MIKLEGSYTFDAPRDVVWEVLMDPNALAKALPGTQTLEEVGENHYRGAMVVRVGPVQGRFEGEVVLTDVRPPEGYHLEVTGKGPQGFLNGQGDLRLEEEDGKTVLHYTGEAQVGGRIAGVGQRLIESTARAIVRQALQALDRQVQARMQPQPEPAPSATSTQATTEPSSPPPPPEVEAPSMARMTFEVARDVFADFVPPEKQPFLLAAVVGVIAFFIGWLVGRSCG